MTGMFAPAVAELHQLFTDFVGRLPAIGIGLVVMTVSIVAARFVKRGVRKISDRYKKHVNVGRVLGRLAHSVVVVLGLLISMVIVFPNFSPGQLVELLGVGSIAIGFAFRDIAQNFLAGILLLVTEPFRLGDQIVVDEFEGTVEEIETRATKLRTYDGRLVVIPNTQLFTRAVVVNTAFDRRRLEYDVGIGFGDNVVAARKWILEAIRDLPSVLSDPAPDVLLYDLADFSMKLRVRWWIDPPRRADALDSRDEVLAAIKATLTTHGVDLPFPTQQVLFHDQTEETDGDRATQREGWPAGHGKVPASRASARRNEVAAEGSTRRKADEA